jgi:hypothetical protein
MFLSGQSTHLDYMTGFQLGHWYLRILRGQMAKTLPPLEVA